MMSIAIAKLYVLKNRVSIISNFASTMFSIKPATILKTDFLTSFLGVESE